MYTQCPECGVAFRVTAEVLKQAAGKVRCGGCGIAFNALEHLSEEKPHVPERRRTDPQLPELTPDEPPELEPDEAPKSISAEQSAALLKTLDELAGEDIRIEDTGVEWRVIASDDDAGDEVSDEGVPPVQDLRDEPDLIGDTGSLKFVITDEEPGNAEIDELLDESPTPVDQFLTNTPPQVDAPEIFEEMRFDDNTPLPDDFDLDIPSPPPEPAVEVPEPVEVVEDAQVDLELGEPDDWEDLLDEVGEPVGQAAPTEEPEPALETGAEEDIAVLTDDGDDDVLAATEDEPADEPLDVDTQFAIQAEAMGIDLSGVHKKAEAEDVDSSPEEADVEPAGSETSIEEDLIAAAFETEATARERAVIEPEVKPADGENDFELDGEPEETGISLEYEEAGEVTEFDEEPERAGAEEAEEAAELDEEPERAGAEEAEEVAELHEEPERAGAEEAEEVAELDEEPERAGAEEAEEVAELHEEPGGDESPVFAEIDDEPVVEEEPKIAEIGDESDFDDVGEATEFAAAETGPAEESIGDELSIALDETGAEDAQLLDDFRAEPVDERSLEIRLDGADDEEPSNGEPGVPEMTEEEMTINMLIDQDLLSVAVEDEDGFASTIVQVQPDKKIEAEIEGRQSGIHEQIELGAEDKADVETEADIEAGTGFEAGVFPAKGKIPLVETIIMEGESIRAEEDDDKSVKNRQLGAALKARQAEEDLLKAKSPGASRIGLIAAAVLLALALVLQFVHQSREALATNPAFNDAVGPVYRMLGQPLTPAWDIKGWRFEATKGSTDETDELLTIYSRIGNQSDGALPYPLVHVSLTDRFEDIIGSRVLEPDEYLGGNADPRELVPAGNTFNAVISIESPTAEATGFKLNVCYRLAGGQLRCAIEDFK